MWSAVCQAYNLLCNAFIRQREHKALTPPLKIIMIVYSIFKILKIFSVTINDTCLVEFWNY